MTNVLLLSTEADLGITVMRCLGREKIRVSVIGSEWCYSLKFTRFCSDYIPCRFSDLLVSSEQLIEEINSYCYLTREQHKNLSFPLIAQEYIPGSDAGLNVLADNGKILAWTIQVYGSETDRSEITYIKHDNILNIGREIVLKSNYNGVANFDMKFEKDGHSVKLLECNPRFWTSLRSSMWQGVNFAYLGVLLALNQDIFGHINYQEGIYIKPRKALAGLIRGQIALKNLSKSTLLDSIQAASDPLATLRSLMLSK